MRAIIILLLFTNCAVLFPRSEWAGPTWRQVKNVEKVDRYIDSIQKTEKDDKQRNIQRSLQRNFDTKKTKYNSNRNINKTGFLTSRET